MTTSIEYQVTEQLYDRTSLVMETPFQEVSLAKWRQLTRDPKFGDALKLLVNRAFIRPEYTRRLADFTVYKNSASFHKKVAEGNVSIGIRVDVAEDDFLKLKPCMLSSEHVVAPLVDVNLLVLREFALIDKHARFPELLPLEPWTFLPDTEAEDPKNAEPITREGQPLAQVYDQLGWDRKSPQHGNMLVSVTGLFRHLPEREWALLGLTVIKPPK